MESTKLKPVITRKGAEQVAQVLIRHPRVHGVELFGSVAREGVGRDLDLVLLVSREDADTFVGLVKLKLMEISTFGDPERYALKGRELHKACTYNSPILRMNMAREVLGAMSEEDEEGVGVCVMLGEKSVVAYPGDLCPSTFMDGDIFLFPEGWQDDSHLMWRLQQDLPHRDPHFMQNIARDAVRIA